LRPIANLTASLISPKATYDTSEIREISTKSVTMVCRANSVLTWSTFFSYPFKDSEFQSNAKEPLQICTLTATSATCQRAILFSSDKEIDTDQVTFILLFSCLSIINRGVSTSVSLSAVLVLQDRRTTLCSNCSTLVMPTIPTRRHDWSMKAVCSPLGENRSQHLAQCHGTEKARGLGCVSSHAWEDRVLPQTPVPWYRL
jgi:hypothetical protein